MKTQILRLLSFFGLFALTIIVTVVLAENMEASPSPMRKSFSEVIKENPPCEDEAVSQFEKTEGEALGSEEFLPAGLYLISSADLYVEKRDHQQRLVGQAWTRESAEEAGKMKVKFVCSSRIAVDPREEFESSLMAPTKIELAPGKAPRFTLRQFRVFNNGLSLGGEAMNPRLAAKSKTLKQAMLSSQRDQIFRVGPHSFVLKKFRESQDVRTWLVIRYDFVATR